MFLVQECADGAIVGRSFNERFNGEALPQLQRRLAFVIAHGFEHEIVIGRIDNNRDALIIFGRASNHRWPADIDIFDCFGQGHIRFRNGLLEWIEIDHDQIDRLEPLFARFLFMLRITPFVEQSAVHSRMQSFHAPFQHFREASEAGYFAHRHTFFTQ